MRTTIRRSLAVSMPNAFTLERPPQAACLHRVSNPPRDRLGHDLLDLAEVRIVVRQPGDELSDGVDRREAFRRGVEDVEVRLGGPRVEHGQAHPPALLDSPPEEFGGVRLIPWHLVTRAALDLEAASEGQRERGLLLG